MVSTHVERTLAGERTTRKLLYGLLALPGSHHFEVRTIDGTANPHIALATVLGLGLVGVQKGLELKIEAVDGPAVLLSAEERTRRGIVGTPSPHPCQIKRCCEK
jgi:glutamine synthetase